MSNEFIVEFECPQCGAPASLEETSRLFICKYCQVKSYLAPRDVYHYVLPDRAPGDKEIIYFPFWRLKALVKDIPLATYGDLIKTANLTKFISEEDKKRPFYFWIPAFIIASKLFLQIASHVTLCQPHGKIRPDMPIVPIYPVNLPISEVLKFPKTIIANFIAFKEIHFPKIEQVEITPQRMALVHLPFQAQGSEFVHPDYRVRVTNKTLEHHRQ